MCNRIRDDIFVYYAPMPEGMDELVLPCLDGYTIYINDKLPQERQNLSFLHALGHIERGDCENECKSMDEKEGDDPVLFLKKKTNAIKATPVKKPAPVKGKILYQQEFVQSSSFKGHKRFNISYYGYPPAEEGVLQFRSANVDMSNAKILLKKVRTDDYTFIHVIVNGFFIGSVSLLSCNAEQKDLLNNKLVNGLVNSAHVRVEYETIVGKNEKGKIVTEEREKFYLFLKVDE